MKKLLILLLLVACAAGVVVWASPYRSIGAMKQAVDDGDSERLGRYIDYPLLRENLKEQLRTGVSSYLQGEGQEDNPFAALGSTLAGRLSDNLVDSWVTPEGVADLMRGHADPTDRGGDGEADDEDAGDDDKLLRDARLSFRSLSEVEVVARDDQDRDITFVMVRHGFIWKLTNVILPLPEED